MNEFGVTSKRKAFKFAQGRMTDIEDEVANEYALTISVQGEEFATLVCTPERLDELVVGFLASEGIVRRAEDIAELQLDAAGGFARVGLVRAPGGDALTRHSKRWIGSCCGKSRQFYLQSDARTAKTVMSRTTVKATQCIEAMRRLQEGSDAFRRTGGVHNAALCSPDALLVARTDIGRHNALDKLFGYCLLHRVSVKGLMIAFSGRISSEVLLKAAKIGVGVVLSKSAPTGLALDLAHDLGITTVGFIRDGQCSVYTHPERIVPE